MGLSELNLALKKQMRARSVIKGRVQEVCSAPRQDDRAQLKCLKVNNELMKYCLL